MVIDLPLSHWRPDAAVLNNPGLVDAYNVVPTLGNSGGNVTYEPVRKPVLYADSSMANINSVMTGFDSLQNAVTYAGNANTLARYESVSRDWDDISRAGGYNTSDGNRWRHIDYNNLIIATNFNDAPQYIYKDDNIQFADLTTLVRGKFIAEHRGFVVLADTYDAFDGAMPNRIRWSALDNPFDWNFAQSTQADFQDISNEGSVTGLVSDTDLWVFTQRSIIRAHYVGTPWIFQFDTVVNGKGCTVPESMITVAGVTYFLSDDGFYSFSSGNLQPIGEGKVDVTFSRDANNARYQHMRTVVDPVNTLIYWYYCSKRTTANAPDSVIVFNYSINEWSQGDAGKPYVFSALTVPMTIGGLNIYGSIANIPAPWGSNLWTGGAPVVWAIDEEGKIFTLTGTPEKARLETQELQLAAQTGNSRTDRTYVSGVRPMLESGTASVSIGARHMPNGAVNWTPPSITNSVNGYASLRSDDRFHRFRIEIDGEWSKASAIQIDAKPSGGR